jgi:hypothetical protein
LTNYILLIGTAVFLVSIGCMIAHSVSAQDIIQVSKLPSGPEIGLDERPTSSKDNGEDSREEDSETTDHDQNIDDDTEENQTTSQENETESEDQPKATKPRKEVEGGLDIANETQFTVPPPYHMKLTFSVLPLNDHEGAFSGCGEWDLTAFVQGKKISLTDAAGGTSGDLWDVCDDENILPINLSGKAEVTLDIPAEDPLDPTDSQPLSIFTVGTEIDGCMRATLPSDLNEVQDVLSDKGTTRPYYGDVKGKIAKIQSDINSNLPLGGCLGSPSLHNDNDLLGVINEVYYPPAYGKQVGTQGTPGGMGYAVGSNQADSSTGDFRLYWKIDCPLCATVRQH